MLKAKLSKQIIASIVIGTSCFCIGGMGVINAVYNCEPVKAENAQCISELQYDVDDAMFKLNQTDEESKKIEPKLKEAEPYFQLQEIKKQAEEDQKMYARMSKNNKTLSTGNYVAGEDFAKGVYNIYIVKGNGNVWSDNMYRGGINVIMGTRKGYVQTFKNVQLPEGTTLTIDGVTVRIEMIRENASK